MNIQNFKPQFRKWLASSKCPVCGQAHDAVEQATSCLDAMLSYFVELEAWCMLERRLKNDRGKYITS